MPVDVESVEVQPSSEQLVNVEGDTNLNKEDEKLSEAVEKGEFPYNL